MRQQGGCGRGTRSSRGASARAEGRGWYRRTHECSHVSCSVKWSSQRTPGSPAQAPPGAAAAAGVAWCGVMGRREWRRAWRAGSAASAASASGACGCRHGQPPRLASHAHHACQHVKHSAQAPAHPVARAAAAGLGDGRGDAAQVALKSPWPLVKVAGGQHGHPWLAAHGCGRGREAGCQGRAGRDGAAPGEGRQVQGSCNRDLVVCYTLMDAFNRCQEPFLAHAQWHHQCCTGGASSSRAVRSQTYPGSAIGSPDNPDPSPDGRPIAALQRWSRPLGEALSVEEAFFFKRLGELCFSPASAQAYAGPGSALAVAAHCRRRLLQRLPGCGVVCCALVLMCRDRRQRARPQASAPRLSDHRSSLLLSLQASTHAAPATCCLALQKWNSDE